MWVENHKIYMLWVVVPAYNEAVSIGRVIRDLFQHGFSNVVVVDDGSSDATARVAREAGAIVLRHAVNCGQGAALETGDEYARGRGAEFVAHFDADGQFDVSDIAKALEIMKKESVDVVFGSRFLDNRSNIPWLKRYFLLPLGRFVNNLFTGVRLTDFHNGFRVLSRRALETIHITQSGMAHNSEIVREVKRAGLTFKEIPVRVVYHEFGQGIGGGFKIIRDLFFNSLISKK